MMKSSSLRVGMKVTCIKEIPRIPKGTIITVKSIDGADFNSEEYGTYLHCCNNYEPVIEDKIVKFDNIDKIPFCELTVEEKKVLVNAYLEGRIVEYLNGKAWYEKVEESGCTFHEVDIYRTKPVKTERQIKIEELETQMAEMKSKIDELKQLED